MWEVYEPVVQQYQKIPLTEERRLIRLAKRGCERSAKETVLRHIRFVIFRLKRKLFSKYLTRFGEDLLTEIIFVLYQKVKTYNLRYYDKNGNFKPVRFVSYIWKRIDGFIIDSIKKEIQKDKMISEPNWERFNYENQAESVEEGDQTG